MTINNELEPSTSTSRIIVDKDADCKRLGIKKPLFICAPMVRYSKLPFRKLVKLYGADIVYTPMIYAENFVASDLCRANEFTTDSSDSPIVQFAAKDPIDFANAAEIIYGQASGIDLNCGCPKSDVRSGGYGSKLLENPELISEIVKQTRRKISDPNFTVSTKIRIKYPIEITVNLCKQLEAAGVDHIAVHGRTVAMRKEPADYQSIKLIKGSVNVPVFANGGCKTYQEALDIAVLTGVDGIMVAEALLENPALFAGHDKTPVSCLKDWFDISKEVEMILRLFQRHTEFMSHNILSKQQRAELHLRNTQTDIMDYFSSTFDMNC